MFSEKDIWIACQANLPKFDWKNGCPKINSKKKLIQGNCLQVSSGFN